MSDRCIEILDDLSGQEGYVFKKLSSGKPLGDGAFRALMERMGAGAHTPHGFRSSFRDWAAERSQETPDVIEMILGHHVGSKTERAYFRSDQLVRRRVLLKNWNDSIDSN